MSKFNEPWTLDYENGSIIGGDGTPMELNEEATGEAMRRIVACVNALAGLNPEAVRDAVEAATIIRDSFWNEPTTGNVVALNIRDEWLPKLDTALAKLKGGQQ